MILKRVGVMSVGKIFAAIHALLGIPVGILFAVSDLPAPPDPFFAVMMSGLGVVIAPLFYGVAGFIFGILFAALYNALSPFIGGIELDFVQADGE